MELTAKEIADDVQQTFDDVTCSYRQILEDRIINYGKLAKGNTAEIATEFIKKCNLIDVVKAKEGGYVELDALLVDFIEYVESKKEK